MNHHGSTAVMHSPRKAKLDSDLEFCPALPTHARPWGKRPSHEYTRPDAAPNGLQAVKAARGSPPFLDSIASSNKNTKVLIEEFPS